MRTIKSIVTAVVVALAVTAMPVIAGSQKNDAGQTRVVTLNVPDMFCGGCELAVKMAAAKATGVKDVKTNSDKRIAEVSYDPAQTQRRCHRQGYHKEFGIQGRGV